LTLWARSDVIHLSLGEQGCGASHSREVTRGAPAKTFKLDCPPCEAYLKGDRKPQKLVYETDRKTGAVLRQVRVADSDPLWGATPGAVPLTPDEAKTNETRQERGRLQIEMLQALAAIRAIGIDVPAEALYLLESELPEGILRGVVVCVNGHDVPAGSKFCGECGASMAARAAVTTGSNLGRLHPQTLRKMCRDQGLPDGGDKDTLIARLAA
jgi:hypothetical protein